MSRQVIERIPLEDIGAATAEMISDQLTRLGGKIVSSSDAVVVAHFGSALWSRMLGEFWVNKTLLPKTVKVSIDPDSNEAVVLAEDRNRFLLIKAGTIRKTEEGLREVADQVVMSLRHEEFSSEVGNRNCHGAQFD